MARIRTVKPEFFTSPDIAKLSYPARLLYIAMWCWADDYGKGETNLNGLLGLAFPESDDLDRKDLQRLCKEVQCGCKVIFYMVNERAYYAIPSWDDHQRTQRKADSRIPGPEDPGASLDPRFHAEVEPTKEKQGASLPLQGEYAPGTEEQGNLEQGNSGAGEQSPPKSKTKPSTAIPANWEPTAAHEKKAHEQGVDLAGEAERFKLHAETHDRKCVNWNSAFTMWLSKARPEKGQQHYMNSAEKKVDVAKHWLSQPAQNAPHDPWAIDTSQRKEITG